MFLLEMLRSLYTSSALLAAGGAAMLALGCSRPPEKPPLPRDVVLYNWEDYTDRPSLAEFEKKTGFHVVLKEFGTTDEELAQLQTNPGAYDVFVSDCENTPLLRDTRLVSPLDMSAIPNAALVDPSIRRGGAYSLPFQGAVTGIAIDTAAVPDAEVNWSILLDPRYREKIALLDDMREVTDTMLIMAGAADRARVDFGALEEIGRRLVENRVSFGDTLDNLGDLFSGRKSIVMTYDGDFAVMKPARPGLRFVLPPEGFRLEYDCLHVSADALNPIAANLLVDFLLEPEVSARWSNAYGYSAVVRGAERFYDARPSSDPIAMTPPDVLRRAVRARDLGDATPRYEQLFHALRRGP
jgi:spermidine/putrescine transport system substrate-binding protein